MILQRLLSCYESVILKFSWWIIALILLGCSLSLAYTVTHLGFNTDTTEMLSPELPFHQNRIKLWKTFPKDVKSILIVVDAPSPESAKNAVESLGGRLEREKDLVTSVYIPGAGDFFEQEALLYLNEEELANLADSLSKAQPLLGRLAENNSLEEFFDLLGKVLTDPAGEKIIDLAPLLDNISEALTNAEAGIERPLSWQKMLAGPLAKFNASRRFILVKAKLDYSQIIPAQTALQTIREHAKTVASEADGIRIRMTGETVLEHEELESVSKGSAISAVVSLILVCATLFWGLRSVKLMFATFLTLIAGLLLTAGFATLAVGHLNMISIAFAVLYIGLGVDYAIHLCLHYQEFQNKGLGTRQALMAGIKAVGPALTLCAITSAVGFYSFIPTSYSGVSELGVISGTSMFIGLGITLTLLPALLNVMKPAAKPRVAVEQTLDPKMHKNGIQNRIIRSSALILAVTAAFAVPHVKFDFDPVHLRDASSESVQTYYDLIKDPDTSPLTLTILESDKQKMRSVVNKIKSLSEVDKVLTINNFVPVNQDAKLTMIDDMALILGPLPQPFPGLSINDRQHKAFDAFSRALNVALEERRGGELEASLISLKNQFEQFSRRQEAEESAEKTLKRFEKNLLSGLPSTVSILQNYLTAEAFGPERLPAELTERWLSPDGVYRIQVFPKRDISRLAHLREFVEAVQAIEPDATDLPVIYLEAGNEVVKAFKQALTTALTAIVLVLLLVLRNARDTVFVLLPLVLAALLTAATSVLIDLPLNFANIIAVPLLFGLGVDSGIHMIHSMRKGTFGYRGFLQNTSSRGIFFSALTTVFSFSSLAFSPHNGTASMGMLLAIGIFFMLLCTLIVLPAFVGHLYLPDKASEN